VISPLQRERTEVTSQAAEAVSLAADENGNRIRGRKAGNEVPERVVIEQSSSAFRLDSARLLGDNRGMTHNVLDDLVGLKLSDPKIEEIVLATCRIRLAELGVDCVHLLFGGDEEVMIERDETVASLKRKLEAIRGQGLAEIEGHGS